MGKEPEHYGFSCGTCGFPELECDCKQREKKAREKIMDKLPACPFCGQVKAVTQDSGSPDNTAYDHPFYAVVCSTYEGGCGATGGWKPTLAEAVAAWKTRTNGSVPVETLQEWIDILKAREGYDSVGADDEENDGLILKIEAMISTSKQA